MNANATASKTSKQNSAGPLGHSSKKILEGKYLRLKFRTGSGAATEVVSGCRLIMLFGA